MNMEDRPLEGPWSKRPNNQKNSSSRPEKAGKLGKSPAKKTGHPEKQPQRQERSKQPPQQEEVQAAISEACPPPSPQSGMGRKRNQRKQVLLLQELLQPQNLQTVILAAEILGQRGGKSKNFLNYK